MTSRKKLRQVRAEFQQALDAEEAGREGLVYLGDPDDILLGTVSSFRQMFGVRYPIDELRSAIAKVDADLEVGK